MEGLTREELLMKLGAARARARAAWRLIDIEVDEKDATFTFALNRDKLRKTRRREGRLYEPGQAVIVRCVNFFCRHFPVRIRRSGSGLKQPAEE
jgi:hypothetical protein